MYFRSAGIPSNTNYNFQSIRCVSLFQRFQTTQNLRQNLHVKTDKIDFNSERGISLSVLTSHNVHFPGAGIPSNTMCIFIFQRFLCCTEAMLNFVLIFSILVLFTSNLEFVRVVFDLNQGKDFPFTFTRGALP